MIIMSVNQELSFGYCHPLVDENTKFVFFKLE